MVLVEENYFSEEAQKYYTGSSQIKSFLDCPAKTMAEINGEWKEEPSQSLLVGSYIDACVTGTLNVFVAKHPEMFKKDGTLKSEYLKAEYAINRIQRDKMFWKYVNGDHQTIMTAVYNIKENKWYKEEDKKEISIDDVPIKIKIDSYFPDKVIVDLKYVKDFNPIWNDKTQKKENFVDYWKYTLQGALYQKVIEVNTEKKLPFFIAAVTKEEEPDLAILNIPQDVLDKELYSLENEGILEVVRNYKNNLEKPPRCEHCNYCKNTKEITKIINYQEL